MRAVTQITAVDLVCLTVCHYDASIMYLPYRANRLASVLADMMPELYPMRHGYLLRTCRTEPCGVIAGRPLFIVP